MREPSWREVKRYLQDRREAAKNQLLGCPLDEVERIRGRVEAYTAVLELENHAPPDSVAAMFTHPE